MKFCHIPFLIFSVASALLLPDAAYAQSDKEYLHDIIRLEQKNASFKKSLVSNTSLDSYDLKYQRIYLEASPDTALLKGSICYYFKSLLAGSNTFTLELSDSLYVDSVKYHNTKLNFSLQRSNDWLSINLNSSLDQNAIDSITVYYHGTPGLGVGMGSYERSTHAKGNVLWTLSEPYGIKEWMPCKQSLNDKIDSLDIYVKTNAAYKVGSNGVLKSVKENGAFVTYHWQHKHPIAAYLIAIAISNYHVYSDYVSCNGKKVEILNYIYPYEIDNTKKQLAELLPAFELFCDLFGDYPFANEKYGHAQFGWGGGMEHQTMSFVGGYNYELLTHELAHQWFGDKISCGSWSEIWLNEGFATYCAALCLERIRKDEWLGWKKLQLKYITNVADGSVFCTDTNNIDRIFSGRLSYSKGAMLLHMLRFVIGDEHFFLAIKNYLNDPQLAYGYATSAQLKKHLEAASKKNLDSFFQDWLYGQGFPSYHLSWFQEDNTMHCSLHQNQSHNSVSFFEMPVPILFSNGLRDTMIVLNHSYSGEEFTVDLGFRASNAAIDPNIELLTFKNTVSYSVNSDELKKDMIIFPNPSSDKLNIKYFRPTNKIEKIEVYDALGNLVYLEELKKQANQYELEIPIEQLKKGMYLVKIYRTEGVQLEKIVKI